jgi:hypothetical protein
MSAPILRAESSATGATVATPRALHVLVAVLSMLFIGAYVMIALGRLGFPYELEWIEGGSLTMAERAASGRPLYVAPSLAYVPFNYPPLYYWVSGFGIRLMGDGFLPLRLISFLSSVACGVLLYQLVRHETGRRLAGWVAVGLFFATFRHAGAWLDVARADSLHLALVLAAFLILRTRATVIGAVCAGALIALGFLAKQSAAVAAFPVVVHLLLTDRRRGGAFTLAAVLGIAAGVLGLDAETSGWFRYYVFELAGRYSAEPGLAARFWTQDFFRPLSVCLLGALFALLAPPESARRGRGVTFAAIGGLLLSSWLVRAYPAAYDNVLMPACAAAALMLGLGWDAGLSWANRIESRRRRTMELFVAVAVALQFVSLVYDPFRQVPRARDRQAGDQLVSDLARLEGSLLLPCHDYLTTRAGKSEHFHEMSLMAVIKSGDDSTAIRLRAQLAEALRDRHWPWIVLDTRDWLWETVALHYEPRIEAIAADDVFWPATGMRRRPEALFTPRTDPAPASVR